MSSSQRDYRTIAAEKRLERSNRIPQKWLIEPETFRTFTNVLQVPVTCGKLSAVSRQTMMPPPFSKSLGPGFGPLNKSPSPSASGLLLPNN
jgi:hypothetical protein